MDIRSIVANNTPLVDVARFVFAKLIAQGVGSINNVGKCQYRQPVYDATAGYYTHSLACGVGQLIDNEDYNDQIEAHSAIDALTLAYGADWVEDHVHDPLRELLDFMQNVHDRIAMREAGSTAMTRENMLEMTEVVASTFYTPPNDSAQVCRDALNSL